MAKPHFTAISPNRFDSTEIPRDRDSEPTRNDIGRDTHEQYSAGQPHEETAGSINRFHSSIRGEQVSQPSDSSHTVSEETQGSHYSLMTRTTESLYGLFITRRRVRSEENYPIQQSQSLHDQYKSALTALNDQKFQQVLSLENAVLSTSSTDDVELLDNIDFVLSVAYRELKHSEKMNQRFTRIIERHSTEALTHLPNSTPHRNVLLAKYHLGGSYLSKQKYSLAAQCLHEAEPYFTNPSAFEVDLNSRTQSCVAKPSKIIYYIQLGNTYKFMSDFEKSEMYFKQALKEAKRDGSTLVQIAPLNSLGILNFELENYSVAISFFTQLLNLPHFANDQNNNDLRSSAHNNLGRSYLEFGNLTQAILHFIDALKFASKPECKANAYNGLGNAYQRSQKVEEAKQQFSKALTEATKANNALLIQRVNGNIALLCIHCKKYEEGIAIFEDMLVTTSSQPIIINIFRHLGCAQYNLAVSLVADHVNRGEINLSVPQSSHSKIMGDPLVHALHSSKNSNVQEVNNAKLLLTEANQHFTAQLDGVFKGVTEQQRAEQFFTISLRQCQVTFNRFQDSLMLLGKYEQALAIAEQSRSKNLFTMLAENGLSDIELDPATPWPLSSDFIIKCIRRCKRPINYISYTGNRLNIWHFNPQSQSDIQVYSVPLDNEYLDTKNYETMISLFKSSKSDCSLYDGELSIKQKDTVTKMGGSVEVISGALIKLSPLTTQLRDSVLSNTRHNGLIWLI